MATAREIEGFQDVLKVYATVADRLAEQMLDKGLDTARNAVLEAAHQLWLARGDLQQAVPGRAASPPMKGEQT